MTLRRISVQAAAGFLSACLFVLAVKQTASAAETYDLLFRTGTLDGISRETVLTYERKVSARANEEIASRESGSVRLAFVQDGMAELTFRQGDRHRTIGTFPASVGNPMILYFVESIVRDMAATSGGSPFYIRNRIKAALERNNPIHEETLDTEDGSLVATTVTLHPFTDDPNRDQMKGFGDLVLTVTMSDQIPGWYYELRADTAAPEDDASADADDAPVYANFIRFQAAEVEE